MYEYVGASSPCVTTPNAAVKLHRVPCTGSNPRRREEKIVALEALLRIDCPGNAEYLMTGQKNLAVREVPNRVGHL